MISIVICHRNKTYLEQIKQNIRDTIGVQYEIIVIDNTNNDYNIFAAYNKGVEMSKGEIICFAHEDISFHSENWGSNLIEHFKNKEVGLIGVIGGTAFPNCPAPWWNNATLNIHLVNLIQQWGEITPADWPRIHQEGKTIRHLKNISNTISEEAVTVDGLFFAIRKELFNIIHFDTTTFNGFHCYDTDTCFQVLAHRYKILVVYDILIEHFSCGSINRAWAESAELLADKWKDSLPVFSQRIDNNLIPLYSYSELLKFCYWIQSIGYRDKEIKRIIKKYLTRFSHKPVYREFLLLFLWKVFGYQFARFPFKILKIVFK